MTEGWFNKIRTWLRKAPTDERCLQCGLPPGRQFLVATEEPILHPHQCSWCSGVLYVPGPMFACKNCSTDQMQRPAA